MMIRQVVWGMLAGIAALALSATAAHAGAGGSPSPLTSFFVCNSISGQAANQTVDLDANVFGPARQSVKIGNATLACAFTRLFQAGTPNEIEPNPPGTWEQLKCYTISLPRQTGSSSPTRYDANDALLGDDPDVKGSNIQLICGPSSFFLAP